MSPEDMEAIKAGIVVFLLFGFPFAVWSIVYNWRETERLVRRCGDCANCKAKKEAEELGEREASARYSRVCVKGHGSLDRTGHCRVCGWY